MRERSPIGLSQKEFTRQLKEAAGVKQLYKATNEQLSEATLKLLEYYSTQADRQAEALLNKAQVLIDGLSDNQTVIRPEPNYEKIFLASLAARTKSERAYAASFSRWHKDKISPQTGEINPEFLMELKSKNEIAYQILKNYRFNSQTKTEEVLPKNTQWTVYDSVQSLRELDRSKQPEESQEPVGRFSRVRLFFAGVIAFGGTAIAWDQKANFVFGGNVQAAGVTGTAISATETPKPTQIVLSPTPKHDQDKTPTKSATVIPNPTGTIIPTASKTPDYSPTASKTPDSSPTATKTKEPSPTKPAEVVCIATDVKGRFEYSGNHVSGDPVIGFFDNIANDPACSDKVFVHIYGSLQAPETPGWLESQKYISTQVVNVPENTTNYRVEIDVPKTDFCFYQVEATRVEQPKNPPYYAGEEMIDYVFVEDQDSCKPTPTASPTEKPDTPTPTATGTPKPPDQPTPTQTPRPPDQPQPRNWTTSIFSLPPIYLATIRNKPLAKQNRIKRTFLFVVSPS